jgi:hypothetical protein
MGIVEQARELAYDLFGNLEQDEVTTKIIEVATAK